MRNSGCEQSESARWVPVARTRSPPLPCTPTHSRCFAQEFARADVPRTPPPVPWKKRVGVRVTPAALAGAGTLSLSCGARGGSAKQGVALTQHSLELPVQFQRPLEKRREEREEDGAVSSQRDTETQHVVSEQGSPPRHPPVTTGTRRTEDAMAPTRM